MSGFFSGKSAFDEAERAKGKGDRPPIIPEFYLRYNRQTGQGETKEIVFCDDTPEAVHGHKVMVGDFRAPRWYTCSAGSYPCKFCEEKFGRTFVGPMTVLVDSWADKNGNVTKWSKRILMASAPTLKKLRIKKENRVKLGEKGLVGCLFSVSRISLQNAIDDCEFLRKVTPQELGVADFAPLDYVFYLKARPREEIEQLFRDYSLRDCFQKKQVSVGSPQKETDVVDY